MRTLFLLKAFWFMATGTLAAQSPTVTDLLQLVTIPPAAFERAMEAKGYTCFQRKKTLTNWSCLFMDQRPAYLNQPSLAPEVIDYIFGPNVTMLVNQTKSAAVYRAWHNQLLSLGYTLTKQPQSNESVGLQYTKEQVSVVLRKVDIYNGIATNLTGYSASVTWMRQPPLLTQQGQPKQGNIRP